MIDLLGQRWRSAAEAGAARATGNRSRLPIVRYVAGASEKELSEAERDLHLTIPESVRNLYRVSKAVEVWWHLGDTKAPMPFHQIFAGDCHWDLARQAELIETYAGWIREVFGDPQDSYDRVWHAKFPVMEVGNGDLIAADLQGRPTYLSHDDGEGHGYILGRDFVDFVDRWSMVGCVGPEDWQWLPFTTSRESGIDPDGDPAKAWRAWLGVGDLTTLLHAE